MFKTIKILFLSLIFIAANSAVAVGAKASPADKITEEKIENIDVVETPVTNPKAIEEEVEKKQEKIEEAAPKIKPDNKSGTESEKVEKASKTIDDLVAKTKETVEVKPEEGKLAEDKKEENADKKPETGANAVTTPAEKTEAEAPKVSVASFVNGEGEISVEGVTLSKNLLAEIYSPRDYKTIFFDGKTPNDNFKKAMELLALADENGLSRKTFDLGIINKRVQDKTQSEDNIAKTDALITDQVVEMIELIGNGHVIPEDLKLQTYFTRPVRVEKPSDVFEQFLTTKDLNALIEKYSPKNPQYGLLKNALKAAIITYQGRRDVRPIEYTGDIVVGQASGAIPEIRNRMGGTKIINPAVKDTIYDKKLELKVKEFQKGHDLDDTGVVDKELVDLLNTSDEVHISRLKVNMERYRWLPDKLEPLRIEVNLPEFKLHAYKDGKEEFTSAAIVGRDEHKTPIMSTKMFQMVLNPYWYVPKAYAIRNMVPLLRQDPDYIKHQNFSLFRLDKAGWKKIDQSEVKWDGITEGNYNYMLRQEPGNLNVLGPVKFAIVNPYDIYLHSTTEPWLFTNKFRGYSSGCIRIEDTIKLGEWVIKNGKVDLSNEEFEKLYKVYYSKDGRALPNKPELSNKYFKLKEPIPVHTTYFSVLVDPATGVPDYLNDFYKLDYEQARALGL